MAPAESSGSADLSASKRALAGFFLLGLVLSFPGAILPAWDYHLRPHYVMLGNYFLAIVAGVVAAVRIGPRVLASRGIGNTLTSACLLVFGAVLLLSFTAPPVDERWRIPCFFLLGIAAGVLNIGIFQAISPAYQLNAAGTVNLGGIFFGLGAFLNPLLIAGTFRLYSVPFIFYLLALVPAAFAVSYARLRFPPKAPVPHPRAEEVLRELRMPGAVLLTLLLFFHFGNEWSVSGWLPLFLVLRLGLDPVSALILLALYWLALMAGRGATQAALSRVRHTRLLIAGAGASLLGILTLAFTNNLFGASLGTVLVGLGFAPIYPLVVEAIKARFPAYHPGFFNGIFSAGLIGGMLAPATLGYAAEFWGIRAVTLLPAAGTCIVLILVAVIWLETRIAEWDSAKTKNNGLG